MADEFWLKMPDFHVTFRGLLHAVNLRHGADGFTSPLKDGVMKIFFRPEKSRGFGRVWTRELGYQRPASTLPLDHRSRYVPFLLPARPKHKYDYFKQSQPRIRRAPCLPGEASAQRSISYVEIFCKVFPVTSVKVRSLVTELMYIYSKLCWVRRKVR